MRFFSIVFCFALLSVLYLPNYSIAQIDITKYASDDLFEAQPVVSQEYIEQKGLKEEKFGASSHFDEFLQEGMDYWSGGEYDDAVYHFDQMAEEFSRKDLCLAAHDRLVKYNSWNSAYLMDRAQYLLELEEYKKAIKDLEKYVKRNKDSGKGYYYLAVVLEESGDADRSKRYFKKAKRKGYERPE